MMALPTCPEPGQATAPPPLALASTSGVAGTATARAGTSRCAARTSGTWRQVRNHGGDGGLLKQIYKSHLSAMIEGHIQWGK